MPARKPTAADRRRAAALLKKQKATFLQVLEDEHLVSEAARRIGVHRQRAYEWRAADEEFARAWAEVEERSTELLEREAYRRAAIGVDKPIHHQGVRVDTVKEFSDVLLIFLLKARRPGVYREHYHHEHTGPEGGPLTAEILTVSAKEASDATHDFLERIAGPEA